jgi:hypothetical protein
MRLNGRDYRDVPLCRHFVRLLSMQLYPVSKICQAMGAVPQRATVPRECESEIEQMGFAPLGIPTRLEPLLGSLRLQWDKSPRRGTLV